MGGAFDLYWHMKLMDLPQFWKKTHFQGYTRGVHGGADGGATFGIHGGALGGRSNRV